MFKKVGVQLWTIRDFMNDEAQIKESFAKLKALGYDEVQTAGCKIPYADFGKLAAEAGLEIVGTHDNFQKMVETPELSVEDHTALGTKIMGIGGFGFSTSKEIEEFIEKANKVADTVYPHGFKFSFHNHSREFVKLDNGRTAMDMLAQGLDPEKTSFVLDTYWVQHGGANPVEWIEKLAGRIDILHLKDMAIDMSLKQYYCEIGNGNINFEKVIEAAEKTGVKYLCVEQDDCPGDPFESLKISREYLGKLLKI